jgi:hypothetical protein
MSAGTPRRTQKRMCDHHPAQPPIGDCHCALSSAALVRRWRPTSVGEMVMKLLPLATMTA